MKLRRGITLVETLVAASLSMVFLGLLAGFFTSGVRSMAKADERLDPREALFTVDLTLRGWLQGATACTVRTDGLDYDGPHDIGQIRYDAAHKFLQLASKARGVLAFANVTAFTVELRK